MLKKAIIAGMIGIFSSGCPVNESTPVNVTESSAKIELYRDGFRKTLDSPFGELRGIKYDKNNSTYIYVTGDKSIDMLIEFDGDGLVDHITANQYLEAIKDRNKEPLLFERADKILKYWEEN